MVSDVLWYLIIVAVAFIVGLILRFEALRRLERRAWGSDGSALSRADRREIRRAVREGRPVGDRRLAVPAVLFAEQVGTTGSWVNPGLGAPPPHRLYVFGRIFFPAIGAFAAVSGILDHDRVTVMSGIVLFALTALYLPPYERRTAARRAAREQRRRTSIDANRRLSPGS